MRTKSLHVGPRAKQGFSLVLWIAVIMLAVVIIITILSILDPFWLLLYLLLVCF